MCLTKSVFNPGLSKGWKLFSRLLTIIRFQLPPQVDLLLIVLLFTAKFSLQSLFQGYYHVLFYAGGEGGALLWLLLQASACQMEGEKKICASLVFGPLFLLALVVFYQHLCCRSAFPWRALRVLSLFFVGALFKLILDSKHDVCCRMWMFCSCKCTFKLDQKLQYTLNSNMPFVKVTNCYCCCC